MFSQLLSRLGQPDGDSQLNAVREWCVCLEDANRQHRARTPPLINAADLAVLAAAFSLQGSRVVHPAHPSMHSALSSQQF